MNRPLASNENIQIKPHVPQEWPLIELTRILLVQTTNAIIISCLTAVVVFVLAWTSFSNAQSFLISWIGILLSINLFRSLHIEKIKKQGINRQNYQKYNVVSAFWAFLSGSSWGLLALLWEPQMAFSSQILIIIVLFGVTAGSLSSNAYNLTVFLAFVSPPLLLLFTELILQAEVEYLRTAFLISVYLFFLFITARRYHRDICQSLRRSYDNQQLVRQLEVNLSLLRDEIDRRIRVEGDLKILTESLEQKVSERTSELQLLYRISSTLANPEISLDKTFQYVLDTIFSSWVPAQGTPAQIIYDGKHYETGDFVAQPDCISAPIVVDGRRLGYVKIALRDLGKNPHPAHYREQNYRLLSSITEKIANHIEMRLIKAHRIQIEKQLNEAHKMESIGQLAAGIAHEINTPTQYVNDNTHFLADAFNVYQHITESFQKLIDKAVDHSINDAQLDSYKQLLEDSDLDFLQKEIPLAVSQSLEGLQRISKIVQAMKDFSHPGSKEMIKSDINRAIVTTIDISRNEWKYVADLTTDLDRNLPSVPIYQDEFNQVILNLIVNAAQAIEDQAYAEQGIGKIHISTRLEGDFVKIVVRDNGCGISEQNKHRVFDHFFTTKDVGRGTGQGLAIARSIIVDKHEGSIEVSSEPGEGATFTIKLPTNRL